LDYSTIQKIDLSLLPRQKNQKAREANFAKYFPPNPQHFAKFRSRSAFAFSVFPHFCFGRSTTLRVVAL